MPEVSFCESTGTREKEGKEEVIVLYIFSLNKIWYQAISCYRQVQPH